MIRERSLAWLLAALGVGAVAIVALTWGEQEVDPAHRATPNEDSPRATLRSADAAVHATANPATNPDAPSIRGRITAPELGPLSEGRVDVHCLGSGFLATATIDEDGGFELPTCSSGPSCVRLTHPSVQQPQAWELGPGEVELEAEAAPAISGVVFDGQTEERIAAAEVIVVHASSHVTTTDADGEYSVALPRGRPCDRCDGARASCEREPPEVARVLVSARGFAPVPFEVDVERQTKLDVAMPPPATALTGVVLDVDGEPFGTRTRVLAVNVERGHERHVADVDASGRFAFDDLAYASEYSLRAIRDGREIAARGSAWTGAAVELRSDLPARGVDLRVEIVDAEAEPIAGARVDGGPFQAAISDAEGRVEASDVLPGRYTLRVRAGDCPAIREEVELEPGAGDGLRRVRVGAAC